MFFKQLKRKLKSYCDNIKDQFNTKTRPNIRFLLYKKKIEIKSKLVFIGWVVKRLCRWFVATSFYTYHAHTDFFKRRMAFMLYIHNLPLNPQIGIFFALLLITVAFFEVFYLVIPETIRFFLQLNKDIESLKDFCEFMYLSFSHLSIIFNHVVVYLFLIATSFLFISGLWYFLIKYLRDFVNSLVKDYLSTENESAIRFSLDTSLVIVLMFGVYIPVFQFLVEEYPLWVASLLDLFFTSVEEEDNGLTQLLDNIISRMISTNSSTFTELYVEDLLDEDLTIKNESSN
jgi:hypothetical protein